MVGVSRAVAGAKGHEDETLRAALRVHVPLALAMASLMAIATPIYVAFEHAPDVAAPLYVLAEVRNAAVAWRLYRRLLIGCPQRAQPSRQLGMQQALLSTSRGVVRHDPSPANARHDLAADTPNRRAGVSRASSA